MNQYLILIETGIKSRYEGDKKLNFWLVFLLSIITCGLYGIWAWYWILQRRDLHISRFYRMADDFLQFIKIEAEKKGVDVKDDVYRIEIALRERLEKKGAVLWLVLVLVFGFVAFYCYYFLNNDFRKHEREEGEFVNIVNNLMNKLGVTQKPILYNGVIEERNFWLYLILTLITCGIFGIYWYYTIIDDGNRHFDEHWRFEDQFLSIIRNM